MKQFNTTGVCVPEKHYMVNLNSRVAQIKEMVDEGKYFTINRARQYGKTTTLRALARYLKNDYIVLSLDFQALGGASFADEKTFTRDFVEIFCGAFRKLDIEKDTPLDKLLSDLYQRAQDEMANLRFLHLFNFAQKICSQCPVPIVVIIDEVDSASNNQVFLDFLAQLRLQYIARDMEGEVAFQSVILAGVTDIKNLRRKLRPEEAHKFNSPWNIAADFNVDMSFNPDDIAGMLNEYEADHGTGMDIKAIAQEIYNFTSGYPFLVSRICQLIDTEIGKSGWNVEGVSESVRRILATRNTLFDSLMGKVHDNPGLSDILQKILFSGDRVVYNAYDLPTIDAEMYGFVKEQDGALAITNRIFETLLYNFYIASPEAMMSEIFQAGSSWKERFIVNGHLNMESLLKRFITVFDELYYDRDERDDQGKPSKQAAQFEKFEKFDEDEGRRRFLLFVRAIINGRGNYYIEAQTRNRERMDLVIDYAGERHVVELKIWRGNAYNERGEEQLAAYLDYYHLKKGYMLSYNFNQRKEQGIRHIRIGDRELVEAVV